MDEYEYRRERIDMKAIVDCYNDEEISSAWEAYMCDALIFPFEARIINNDPSKIPIGETVLVTDSLGDFDIEGTISWLKSPVYSIEELEVQWNNEEFHVGVENLEPLDKDIQAIESIKDWNFWLKEY